MYAAQQCTLCPKGSYRSEVGGANAQCDACPKGTFGAFKGALQCTSCPAGTVGAFLRAVSVLNCTECPKGTFFSNGSCNACPLELERDKAGVLLPLPDGCTLEIESASTRRHVGAWPPFLLWYLGTAVAVCAVQLAQPHLVGGFLVG